MDGNNLEILLTYNVSCPWWTKIAKNIPEELGGIVKTSHLDVQERQGSVYVERCYRQANGPNAILSRSSPTTGKSLVLKGNISKVIRPGTIFINNSVENIKIALFRKCLLG